MKTIDSEVLAGYNSGREKGRLHRGLGLIEFERTKEILLEELPSPPAVIYDIGGGYGEYAFWLTSLGYEVYLYDIAEEKIHDVVLTYTKERFYLKNTQIYDDLEKYIYNDLYDIFCGKLSYAYRFEAIPSGNPTTKEDYMKAYKTLNTIMDNYI